MKVQQVFCDVCGEAIAADASVIEVTAGVLRASFPAPIDLCPTDAGRFVAWLRQGDADGPPCGSEAKAGQSTDRAGRRGRDDRSGPSYT